MTVGHGTRGSAYRYETAWRFSDQDESGRQWKLPTTYPSGQWCIAAWLIGWFNVSPTLRGFEFCLIQKKYPDGDLSERALAR